MTRHHYVQDRVTGEFHEVDHSSRRPGPTSAMVMPDIGEFTSPVDDRPIHGRKQWREDLKRHNSVPYETGMREAQVRRMQENERNLERRVEQTVVELANHYNIRD